MKKGEKKKQSKALAKRTERKSAKKAQQVAAAEGDLRPIRQARKYPLEGCWVQSGWQEAGLAVVVVACRQPNGLLVVGNFLVDYYCLGVKSCFARPNVSSAMFYAELPQLIPGEALPITAELAHELIWGGIEYAARYGFRPDPDFKLAQLVVDPPEAHPRTGAVTFGKDGKPFYVSGPHDNVSAIMNQLLRTAGPDNYEFLTEIGAPPDELFGAFEDSYAVEDESPED